MQKSAFFIFFICLAFAPSLTGAQTVPPELPKFSMSALNYLGAFRLKNQVFGDARFAWTNGEIAVDPQENSFFFSGSNKRSVGQFSIPELNPDANSLSELPMVTVPIQNFSNLISRAESGNPDGINQIIGLSLIGGKLVVNAAEYYDGGGSDTDTTLVVENPKDLAGSPVRGFMKLEGRNHAGGWMSPVPQQYEEFFGADYIAGHASNLPINSRSSIGPSAFLVESTDILSSDTGQVIPTIKLLDFSINAPLHPDLENKSLENDIWTELSNAEYGFIVPGTSTYLTIGNTGGHETGVGYKITQPNGYQCGGFCAYDHRDYSNYVWLWDVNDLVASYRGEIAPSSIRPYSYGRIELPFELSENKAYVENPVIGATYSAGRFYIVLGGADKIQSEYEDAPVILVYEIGDAPIAPSAPTSVNIQ